MLASIRCDSHSELSYEELFLVERGDTHLFTDILVRPALQGWKVTSETDMNDER